MSDGITAEQQQALARPMSPGAFEDGTPVAEFPWSDRVVGIGFLPEEVGLASGWTWRDELRS